MEKFIDQCTTSCSIESDVSSDDGMHEVGILHEEKEAVGFGDKEM
jgi:hypothetical protein